MARTRRRGVAGEATKSVEVKQSGNVVKDEEKVVNTPVEEFEEDEEVGYVEVGGSSTYNLGNYNSAKVSVSIKLPTATDDESIRATYQVCSDYVLDFINTETEALNDESEA